jgi:hypothetical protein
VWCIYVGWFSVFLAGIYFVVKITSAESCSYFLRLTDLVGWQYLFHSTIWCCFVVLRFCRYSSSVVLVFVRMLPLECCPVGFVFR